MLYYHDMTSVAILFNDCYVIFLNYDFFVMRTVQGDEFHGLGTGGGVIAIKDQVTYRKT